MRHHRHLHHREVARRRSQNKTQRFINDSVLWATHAAVCLPIHKTTANEGCIAQHSDMTHDGDSRSTPLLRYSNHGWILSDRSIEWKGKKIEKSCTVLICFDPFGFLHRSFSSRWVSAGCSSFSSAWHWGFFYVFDDFFHSFDFLSF